MVADDLRRKGRQEPSCLLGVTEGTFRVFDSGMYGLGGFKLLGTLFAAILVERHGLVPFLFIRLDCGQIQRCSRHGLMLGWQ